MANRAARHVAQQEPLTSAWRSPQDKCDTYVASRPRGAPYGVVLALAMLVTGGACRRVREQPAAGAPPVDPAAYRDPLRTGAPGPAVRALREPVSTAPNPLVRYMPKTVVAIDAGVVTGRTVQPVRRPDAVALNRTLNAAMDEMAGCFAGAAGPSTVAVSFVATADGHARDVTVRDAPTAAASCVRSLLGRLALPEFDGDPVPVDFPLSVARNVVAPSQPPAESAPAGAPAVFVAP